MSDWRDWTRLLVFVSTLLLSTFILLFLLSSSVCLSYFYLAVRMRECLGKHSYMSSSFSIAILNRTCSLPAPILLCGDVLAIKQLNYKQTKLKPVCLHDARFYHSDGKGIEVFLHQGYKSVCGEGSRVFVSLTETRMSCTSDESILKFEKE